MSTYTTKFNVGETAYFADSTTLNIVSLVLQEIYVRESLLSAAPVISYRGRYVGDLAGKTMFDEAELFYLEEAKAQLTLLLAQRAVDVNNIV